MSGQVHYRNQEERIDQRLGYAQRATTIFCIVAIVFFLTNKSIVSTTMAQGTTLPTSNAVYTNNLTDSNVSNLENSATYLGNSNIVTTSPNNPNTPVEYQQTKTVNNTINNYAMSPDSMPEKLRNEVNSTFSSDSQLLESCTFRLAWAGPFHRWKGYIKVISPESNSINGKVVAVSSLGIGTDQAAAYSFQQGVVYIHQKSPRSYDGYDITVTGCSGCKVRITLCAENFSPQSFEINWDDLYTQPSFRFNITDTKVTVRRVAGDALRLKFDRDNLVFSPSETFTAILTPYKLPKDRLTISNSVTISVKVQHPHESFDIWHQDFLWDPETGGDIALSIPLPKEEGVYDVIISARCSDVEKLMPRVSGVVNKQLEKARFQIVRDLAKRNVQLVIIDPKKAPLTQKSSMETSLECEIDPTKPHWWDQLERLSQFSYSFKGKQWEYPMGNGNTRISQSELGPITELAANRSGEEPCWEAYICPIERPGIPHILEIEYPSNSEQTTGISILEPDANGAIEQDNIDSGFHVTSDSLTTASKVTWRTHRIIFWPKTKSPIVVVYNLRDNAVSRYGKIRVMSVVGKLPKTYSKVAPRLLAAYLDKPRFPNMFSANKATLAAGSPLLLDSWESFYDGTSRMIEYFNFVGYNGAMISVTCDGSSIWPCNDLTPTPLYDTGSFAPYGNDPVRKDVLEAMLRLFDRQNMRLIPALELSQPIFDLEAKVRASNSQNNGLQWIGENGKTILNAYPSNDRAAMYYNILNPEVQQTVLNIVSQLVTRYKNHPSFTGLAIQLTDSSWMVLPPPQWGMDDETVRRFTADTGIQVPEDGQNRFETRAKFLTGPAKEQWLQWRSEKLTEFYCQLRDVIQSDGVKRKLYLSGAKLFTGCHRSALTPKIPQKTGVEEAMLQCGLGANYGFGTTHDIVLMYTQRVLNGDKLNNTANDRQWNVMSDTQEFFGTKNGQRIQASLFYHPYREIRLKEFEKKCPYTPACPLFRSVPTPTSWENRRRFVQSLGRWDTLEFFDGGWSLAFGEEESVTNSLAAFRCLAYSEYKSIQENTSEGSVNSEASGKINYQPNEQSTSRAIICRWVFDGKSTWAYAVNTTPYKLTGKIKLIPKESDLPVNSSTKISLDNVLHRMSEQYKSGDSCVDSYPSLDFENNQPVWKSTFLPFEIQVVRFDANVTFEHPIAIWENKTIEELHNSLNEIASRASSLKTIKTLSALGNPDFELPTSTPSEIPQWITEKKSLQTYGTNPSASIDNRCSFSGKSSLHLISNGLPVTVSSGEIATDATGRFTVSFWVKKNPEILLRCRLYTISNNTIVERNMYIKDGNTIPIEQKGDWCRYRFHVNDLPLDNMGDIKLSFELPQKGEAWIDCVTVSDMYFMEYEQTRLCESLQPMIDHFTRGEYEYCWKFQQGYWTQFLLDCVEMSNNNFVSSGITAQYNGAIGQNVTDVTELSGLSSVTETSDIEAMDSGQPVQLTGTNQRKNRFGLNLGLGRAKEDKTVLTPQVTIPSTNATPKPEPEPEKKTLWQRATSWLPW